MSWSLVLLWNQSTREPSEWSLACQRPLDHMLIIAVTQVKMMTLNAKLDFHLWLNEEGSKVFPQEAVINWAVMDKTSHFSLWMSTKAIHSNSRDIHNLKTVAFSFQINSGKNCGCLSCYGLELLPLLPVPVVGAEVLTASLQVKRVHSTWRLPNLWSFGGQWVWERWQISACASQRSQWDWGRCAPDWGCAHVPGAAPAGHPWRGPRQHRTRVDWRRFGLRVSAPSDGQIHQQLMENAKLHVRN